jgi:LemA protein
MGILAILLIIAAVIIGGIVMFAGWLIGVYNMIIMGLQTIKNQWSNVKTEYQRRADLFYNLAEAVKSYKKFEKSTMVELAQARSGNFGKGGLKSEMEKMKGLDKIFHGLYAVSEAYPQLKANESYKTLMDEVKLTENRINIARTDYNELVRDYNILIKTFPNFLVANWWGYKDEPFFENDPESDKAPKMSLE